MEKLTNSDLSMILESLKYTKIKFEDYDQYPSLKFKQERIDEVIKVIDKIKVLIKNGI